MNYFLLLFLFVIGTLNSMEKNPLEQRLVQIENNMRSAQQAQASRENAIIEAIAVTQLNQEESNLRLKAVEAVALDEFATTDFAIHNLNTEIKKNAQQLASTQQWIMHSNKDLSKQILALEHQLISEKKTSAEQIKSLSNQTAWLRWGLEITIAAGAVVVGYLWHRNSVLSTEIETIKTDHKNLVNVLLEKKPETSNKELTPLEARVTILEENQLLLKDPGPKSSSVYFYNGKGEFVHAKAHKSYN